MLFISKQLGQNVNWLVTKEEIVKASRSDIFLKLTGEPVPVSSARTNQLKLSACNFDKINELFSSDLF